LAAHADPIGCAPHVVVEPEEHRWVSPGQSLGWWRSSSPGTGGHC
jgi:hypothetical protein